MFSRIVLKRIKPQNTVTKYKNFHKNTTIFNGEFPDPEGNKKVVIRKEIKELGDKILEMNIYDSLLLGEYIKERLGTPGDMPDPFQAVMLGLGNLSNPFGGMMGGGMPMQGMQMQQVPVQQAPAAEAPKEEEPPKEETKEKSIFDIKLESVDPAKKINLIKELRKIDSSLGIKQVNLKEHY
eukprot:gene9493-1699_t